jgi:hypothetical protein
LALPTDSPFLRRGARRGDFRQHPEGGDIQRRAFRRDLLEALVIEPSTNF